jgi:thiamine biosynthesis lipoprotein
MIALGRRRFIALTAVAAGVTLLPSRQGWAAEPIIWRGDALGADASLTLYAPDKASGRRLLAQSLAELERLEGIFSLYRDDTALVRLNRQGYLDEAPAELVELLSVSRHFSQLSDGAFDVTVQPLWELYAEHFSHPNAALSGPPEAALANVRPLLDWRAIAVDSQTIAFSRPHMSVTLNGIAQGYVTDKVAELLRRQGMQHVLVDMGEIQAIGPHPDGMPWRVGLEGAGEIALIDRAVSTSSPDGTRFSPACNHLFDPKTGHCSQMQGTISVVAPSATVADALSTAIAVGGRSLGNRIAERLGTVQIIYGTSQTEG